MLPKASLTWSLLLGCAHGAFIRYWPCDLNEDVLSGYQFEPSSLRGSLSQDDGNSSLALRLTGNFIRDDCDELNGTYAAVTVDARVLGSSVIHGDPLFLVGVCPTLSRKESPRYDPRTDAVYKTSFPLDHGFRFSTLDTEIQLWLNETNIACLQAHITPDFGPFISKALMGAPMAIMILSGIATGVIRTYQKRRSRTFRYELENNSQDPAKSSLPGLGPCLHYIQFIFLMGCLTLPYPGFFRAAMSKLAWSSLIFRNWPVTHQFVYPGIEDGIFTANATYGLEEMAQYLGSTTTSDLWTNSLVNLVLVGLGMIVAIMVAFGYRWLRQVYASHGVSQQTAYLQTEIPSLLRRTGWAIARLVLDYTLHPLISFSLFQAHSARWFPGHTSLAMIIVAALAALRVLLIRHLVKTNRLSLFSNTFLPGPPADLACWTLLYSVPFTRGLAIGGLQQSALAQMIVLIGCESLISAHAVWSCSTAKPSLRYTFFALARLATVCMSCVFLPQAAASERTKAIVAYTILVLHAMVLLIGFAVDCVWAPLRYMLYHLGVVEEDLRPEEGAKPPVFGIKQLAHRSTRRVSFGRFPALDPDAHSLADSPPRPHTRESASIRYASSEYSPNTRTNSSFRVPPSQKSYGSEIPFAAGYVPQDSNSSDNSTSSGFELDTVELQSLGTNSSDTVNDPEYYSQRESDQYYSWGRRQTSTATRRVDESVDESPSDDQGHSWRGWLWKAKPQRTNERGFEVIRPSARTPFKGAASLRHVRLGRWSVPLLATIAIGYGVTSYISKTDSPSQHAEAERLRKNQQLMDAYGYKDNVDDLQKALEAYEVQ
ncbi:hypothetical protein BJY00DRAFT_308586 [Aspergillus carlsbadensis]|nr:hypothetical protein BJY00DRAFT_308586 [Aspergillus carlsbadensis]